ncbi:hypothetical protein BJX68DRAFT_225467 [Aspergillus pseudodeflectus]|uniref:Uncharacterized protein n=1 Tax=Aspergillus pseudodeflectus TaxID=176178 RepID=A0ABR4L7R9_9EURO
MICDPATRRVSCSVTITPGWMFPLLLVQRVLICSSSIQYGYLSRRRAVCLISFGAGAIGVIRGRLSTYSGVIRRAYSVAGADAVSTNIQDEFVSTFSGYTLLGKNVYRAPMSGV